MLLVFDENFPIEFVRAFSILEAANKRAGIKITVTSSRDLIGTGSTDERIIEAASKKAAVVVTHDSYFKRIKHYKPLLLQHEVGYIYFRVPNGKYEFWDIVKAFVNKWEDLKTHISKSTHPFAFEINKVGQIQKLSF